MHYITENYSPASSFRKRNRYNRGNEFEIPGNTSQAAYPDACQCNSEVRNGSMEGDVASGWEADNESFTKRSAEVYLKDMKSRDTIQKITNCCIDPDFFMRKCEFVTAKNIRGKVLWMPFNKQVIVYACINGQKIICWYDYFVRAGKLVFRNKKCLSKKIACS